MIRTVAEECYEYRRILLKDNRSEAWQRARERLKDDPTLDILALRESVSDNDRIMLTHLFELDWDWSELDWLPPDESG